VTTADDFQAALENLAQDSESHVLEVYAAYTLAQLDAAAATALIAVRINFANAAAVSLADAYVVSSIEELGEPATSVVLLYEDQGERLTQAVDTILTEPTEFTPEDRLTRLAHAEPFSTAQKASVDAMSKQPLVEGWQRQFESAKPCKLCVFIARIGPDGPRVWPKNHPFQVMHTGDKCVPKIVLRQHIQPTGRRRRNGR